MRKPRGYYYKQRKAEDMHTEGYRPLRMPDPPRPWAVVREIVAKYGSAQRAVLELSPEEYLMATNRERCGTQL